jgi:glycosyltransferase involved in cell wall biosynthesis
MPSEVSIIIPTKNAGPKFMSVLEAIYRNTGYSFEVIIIDSGSGDGTKEAALKFPVRLIEIPPQSFNHGKARNRAAEQASGFITFLRILGMRKSLEFLAVRYQTLTHRPLRSIFWNLAIPTRELSRKVSTRTIAFYRMYSFQTSDRRCADPTGLKRNSPSGSL